MKKICLIVIIAIVLGYNSNCYTQNEKPEKIYSFVKVDKPAKWYKEQSVLWKKEIDKNMKNADAWYNYYRARKYSVETDTIESKNVKAYEGLADIIKQMEKEVPDSYEYNLLNRTYAKVSLGYFSC